MFTFRIRYSPGWAAATLASSGATMRQGPHHGAQKSTTTGMSLCAIAASNVAASGVSIGSPGGLMAVAALAAPRACPGLSRRVQARKREAVSLSAGWALDQNAFTVELRISHTRHLLDQCQQSSRDGRHGSASRSIFAAPARPSCSRSSADAIRRSSAAVSSTMLPGVTSTAGHAVVDNLGHGVEPRADGGQAGGRSFLIHETERFIAGRHHEHVRRAPHRRPRGGVGADARLHADAGGQGRGSGHPVTSVRSARRRSRRAPRPRADRSPPSAENRRR